MPSSRFHSKIASRLGSRISISFFNLRVRWQLQIFYLSYKLCHLRLYFFFRLHCTIFHRNSDFIKKVFINLCQELKFYLMLEFQIINATKRMHSSPMSLKTFCCLRSLQMMKQSMLSKIHFNDGKISKSGPNKSNLWE